VEAGGTIHIYIDEVNMHYQLKLKDDPRIEQVVFFHDDLTVVAHLTPKSYSSDDHHSDEGQEKSSKKGVMDRKEKAGGRKES